MKKDKEVIQTFLPDGRKGESLLKTQYERWTTFILSTLAADENFTLNDLLEKARKDFPAALHNEIGWHILQVKRDLEARGFIKSTEDPDLRHTFYLKLTRQGLSKLQYQNQLSEWSDTE